MLRTPMLLSLIILCSVALPVVGVLLCSLIVMLQIGLIAVRTGASGSTSISTTRNHKCKSPVFSVHVAIHDEPPAMVAGTLHALAEQTWPAVNFEVIVIDNNTTDPAIWKPVRDVCRNLGPGFRFFHRMGVKEAKAGALNIALSSSRTDATHIVTVDADYRVIPQFLAIAARELRSAPSDYIQFPQAYFGCERVAAGVDAELEEYFRTTAVMADDVEAVLLTGTLSVISKPSLDAVGGWSGRTTTEDAEMGVRLCSAGYCGRFIPRIVGRGLLPFSLGDLEKQRDRWASGNLQTLIAYAPAILSCRQGLGWRKRGAIVSQLTAWLNLSLLPAGILLAVLVSGVANPALVTVASASVLLTFASIVGRLLHRAIRDGKPIAVMVSAVMHRVALAPISALATSQVMLGGTKLFIVTDKSAAPRTRRVHLSWTALMLFGLAALALIPAWSHGWFVIAADIVLLLPLPAAIATAWTLEGYRRAQTGFAEAAAA